MVSKIQVIIYIMYAGIIFASLIACYNGKVLGGFIRRLYDRGCTSKEKTASVGELGYSRFTGFLIELSLGENSSLRKFVKGEFSKEEMEVYREKKLPQKYYLPEESKSAAYKLYDGSRITVTKFVVGVVLSVVAAVISINVIPYIFSWMNVG